MSDYRIDLGCGHVKKPGCIGIDIGSAPGVDIVMDIANNKLPFADGSVSYIFSSHFLEHVADPTPIFAEIGRISADGAILELWTPYAWSNSAFITDHKMFFNEDHYLHMCTMYVDFWRHILNSTWLLTEIHYVIEKEVLVDLANRNEDLDFAIRHYKGVVKEFCANIVVRKVLDLPPVQPIRTWSLGRDEQKFCLPSAPTLDQADLGRAMSYFQHAYGN
jgi:predicted SAM-dependent methyltransferase